MRTPILWVAIAGGWWLAGCGDSPNCESAIRSAAKRMDERERPAEAAIAGLTSICTEQKWPGDVRTCVSTASSMDKLGGCVDDARARSGNGMKKGKRSEAELNLDAIGKSAKTHYAEMAEFPKGSAPLTPASSCCDHSPSRKCPPTATDWVGVPIWDALDFEMTEPHFFRYSYESDGATFVARAVGDLDCDLTLSTFELRGEVVNGSPSVTLIKPQRPD